MHWTWNRVEAQQLTKEFCINHIPSMARHTRDLSEQKNAAQMQITTIKAFVAAVQNTSGIYITISQETKIPVLNSGWKVAQSLEQG